MLESRTAELQKALLNYFSSDNPSFKDAYAKTIGLDLFDTADVQHVVKHYIDRLKKNDLVSWLKQTPTSNSTASGLLLYLGAGNIPLVWLQDFCAIIISGVSCSFKYSSKSPYFIESLYNYLKTHNSTLCDAIRISPKLSDFHSTEHNYFTFTGDSENEKKVRAYCHENGMLNEDAKTLIRRAQYSIVYIENPLDKNSATQLVESILRYRNQGCRSVAIVVSPKSFKSLSCGFTDYIESYYLQNKPSKKDNPLVLQKYAYYKALGKPVYWLDQFIILENDFDSNAKHVISWFEGDFETAKKLYSSNKEKIQAFYTETGVYQNTECLEHAQTPPLYWQPDGKNFLDFILND